MRVVLIIFLGALTLTGFSTPWIRQLAIATGFVDAPSKRKLHATPMPLMGGMAIFVGLLILPAIYFAIEGQIRLLGLIGGAAIVSIVGLIDDRKPLPPLIKLGGQAVAFILVIALGTSVALPRIPVPVDWIITFIWFAIITNSVNFLDNMDGLCAGVSGVASAFVVLMADMNGQYLIAPIAAAMLGACLGFLRYNFKPARIFMGDAGSLLLGYMLAALALLLKFPDNSAFVTWMVPLFIMGVPLFDLSLVFVARLRRGVNPLTTAGKDHTSHRLVRMGFSQREAVLILYLLGGVFGMIALFITRANFAEGFMVGGTAALLGVFGIYRLLRREEMA